MISWLPNKITFRPWINEPLETLEPILSADVSNFDRFGFQLTELEKEYYKRNEVELISSEDTYISPNFYNHWPLVQPWFKLEKHSNIFVNRANVYTRYGISGRARYELEKSLKFKPEVRRIMDILPYWALQIQIDWIDDKGSYELLNIYKHYTEVELFRYDKKLIEDVLNAIQDWELECKLLHSRHKEWENLDFSEQNTYKKVYFGINV